MSLACPQFVFIRFWPHLLSFKATDNSRVGGPENPLLTNDLSTTMTMPAGPAAFNEDGSAKYQNRYAFGLGCHPSFSDKLRLGYN